MLIDVETLEEARKEIEKAYKKGEKVVVIGKDESFNRKILENKKVDMLVLNHKGKRDKLKQRDLGLNHILCKIAKKNNITLAFDMREILNAYGIEKAEILGRIIQNIQLCKKYKTKYIVITRRQDKYDIFSLLLCLGADTKTAKIAVKESIEKI